MWAFNALLMLLGALGPSAILWVSRQAPKTALQGLACYLTTDAVFLVSAIAFLKLGILYGRRQYPKSPPYLGAWIERDGRQRPPAGFLPFYLAVAFVISFIVPCSILLYFLVQPASSTSRPLVLQSLLPYLLVFVPQMLLETRYMRTTVVAPTIPIIFMMYRLWQFIRSLNLVHAAGPGVAAWLDAYLLATLSFWIFDTASLLTWLPWTYNWHLQPDMSSVHSSKLASQAGQSNGAHVD